VEKGFQPFEDWKPCFEPFACPTRHSGGRNFFAHFAVKNNRKGNTKI
jgi:hypothetical protein